MPPNGEKNFMWFFLVTCTLQPCFLALRISFRISLFTSTLPVALAYASAFLFCFGQSNGCRTVIVVTSQAPTKWYDSFLIHLHRSKYCVPFCFHL